MGSDVLTVATATGAFADKNVGTGKTVSITGLSLGGGDAANYTLISTTATTTADIIAASITGVTGITALNKVYDATTAAALDTSGVSFTGRIGSDVLTVASGTGAFADKNVGTGKTVTVTGLTLGGADAGNYVFSGGTATTTASITPATISSVTGIAAFNKSYDATTAATLDTSGVNFAGRLGSDVLTVTGGTSAFADKNAGTAKTVTISGLTFGGADAGNYVFNGGSSATTTANITRASVTVTGATAANKIYDATTAATLTSNGTLNGLQGGETLALNVTGASFADKNVGTAKAVTISGYSLADGSGLASNYQLDTTSAAATANITPATISAITGIGAVDKVYDATTAVNVSTTSASFTGRLGSDVLTVGGGSGSFADKNVGTNKAITVTGLSLGGADAGNYTLASTSGTATGSITAAPLTVSGVAVADKTYDGTTAATLTSAGSLSGLQGGETLTLNTGSVAFTDKNAGTGKTVNVSGYSLADGTGLASNYQLITSGLSTSATISRATISAIAGLTAVNKVYDATTAASINSAGATFTGRIGSDNLTVAAGSASFADKNVGTGKTVSFSGLTLGGADAGNYVFTGSTPTLTADITPATISGLMGIAANKIYDATTNATLNTANATFVGKQGSDDLTVSAGSGSFADKNVGVGKTVTITGLTFGGTDAGNYIFASGTSTTTATITAAPITISGVTANNKVYDATTGATVNVAGATLSGKLAGDSLTLTGATGSFADKNVGTGKAVNITGLTLSGADAGNYALASSTAAGTATITAATIASVGGFAVATRTYDGTTNASLNSGGAIFTGKLGSDVLTVASATGAFADKNAATGKTVNISGIALGGSDAGNYVLASTSATAIGNIDKAAITITGVSAQSKVYDGTTAAVLNTSGASFGGKIAGDDVQIAGNLTGAFVDKNAGTGKAVTFTGLTLSGADAGNYTAANTSASTTADITPATISGLGGLSVLSKSYDGTTTATLNSGGVTFTGKIGSDVLTLGSVTANFADKNAATGKAVFLSGINLGGADARNYVYTGTTSATLVGTINPALLTLTGLTAANKVYDTTTNATLTSNGTLSGLVNGETLNLQIDGATFADKNAGTGKTVTVTGYSLTNGTGLTSNYAFSTDGLRTRADITPAAIAGIGGITAASRLFDGTTDAVLDTSAAGFTGRLGSDVLTVATATGAFETPDAGTAKTVDISGLSLGGADAGNYVLASTTARTTANIMSPVPANVLNTVTGSNQITNGVNTLIASASPAAVAPPGQGQSLGSVGTGTSLQIGGGGSGGVSAPSGAVPLRASLESGTITVGGDAPASGSSAGSAAPSSSGSTSGSTTTSNGGSGSKTGSTSTSTTSDGSTPAAANDTGSGSGSKSDSTADSGACTTNGSGQVVCQPGS